MARPGPLTRSPLGVRVAGVLAAVQVVEDAIWVLMGSGGRRGVIPAFGEPPTPILGQREDSDRDGGEEGRGWEKERKRHTERRTQETQRPGTRDRGKERHAEMPEEGTEAHSRNTQNDTNTTHRRKGTGRDPQKHRDAGSQRGTQLSAPSKDWAPRNPNTWGKCGRIPPGLPVPGLEVFFTEAKTV